MSLKELYDWLNKIKNIGKEVRVSMQVADMSFPAIEIRVDFINIEKQRCFCFQVIDIANVATNNLCIALDRLSLFVKSHSSCSFKKK